MQSEEEQLQLAEMLDKWMDEGPSKMFISKASESGNGTKALRRICLRMENAVTEIRTRKLTGSISRPSCALYEALVYKFGVSNRHQRFWHDALKIHRELKRLNRQDILGPFVEFSQRLKQSGFLYLPSKRAVRYLAATLLRRILQLDKLRLTCAYSADCSMGYIELRHFLTFNLMSIAIASDVSSEACRQMQQLATLYDSLADWFRRSSKSLPISTGMLKLKSIASLNLEENANWRRKLKEHDLALLRKEIEGIGQEPVELEQFAKVNVPIAMRNLALERFNNGGQKSLLMNKRTKKCVR